MSRRPLPLPAPRTETDEERAERRRKLRRLDHCLDVLEAAMERDRTVVGTREAAVLAETTPMLHEGMAVPDAIEVILLLQEAYMLPINPPPEPRRPSLAQVL
ncbi:MAG TPA: hypothetical protein VH134_05870 [Candidatus Dormibacteraeota bacterium]|nr:hypothetical protein [Candidatus Dormibacteraeota bacterium]